MCNQITENKIPNFEGKNIRVTLTIMGKTEKHGNFLMENMPFQYPEDQHHEAGSGMVPADCVQIETWYAEGEAHYPWRASQTGFIVSTTNPKKWYEFAKKNNAEISEGVF